MNVSRRMLACSNCALQERRRHYAKDRDYRCWTNGPAGRARSPPEEVRSQALCGQITGGFSDERASHGGSLPLEDGARFRARAWARALGRDSATVRRRAPYILSETRLAVAHAARPLQRLRSGYRRAAAKRHLDARVRTARGTH